MIDIHTAHYQACQHGRRLSSSTGFVELPSEDFATVHDPAPTVSLAIAQLELMAEDVTDPFVRNKMQYQLKFLMNLMHASDPYYEEQIAVEQLEREGYHQAWTDRIMDARRWAGIWEDHCEICDCKLDGSARETVVCTICDSDNPITENSWHDRLPKPVIPKPDPDFSPKSFRQAWWYNTRFVFPERFTLYRTLKKIAERTPMSEDWPANSRQCWILSGIIKTGLVKLSDLGITRRGKWLSQETAHNLIRDLWSG